MAANKRIVRLKCIKCLKSHKFWRKCSSFWCSNYLAYILFFHYHHRRHRHSSQIFLWLVCIAFTFTHIFGKLGIKKYVVDHLNRFQKRRAILSNCFPFRQRINEKKKNNCLNATNVSDEEVYSICMRIYHSSISSFVFWI